MQTARWTWLAGAAALALAPAPAMAQNSARQAELEARLKQLEEAVASLRAELSEARAAQATSEAKASTAQQQANAAAEQSRATATRVAAIEAKPTPPAEGFKVGPTTVKIGGFIRTVASMSHWSDGDVAVGALGRDFYVPAQIPIGGGHSSTDNDYSAKQTRLSVSLDASPAGHVLKGYVEADFQTAPGTQGTERTTNGYDLALRRAYVQFDGLTIGQDWSTFQYVTALPESTDFVGASEGTVFSRQPLIRYSMKLSPKATLHLAAENPDSSSITRGTAALVDNDASRMPDFVARLNYVASFGELSLAGVARELAVRNGAVREHSGSWGVSAAGKLPIGKKGTDLRFMATYGAGIGRYVGLNFAPDAVLDPTTGDLHKVDNFAAFAALRVALTPTVRSSLIFSYQRDYYDDVLPAAAIAALNEQAWSAAGNIFWSPVKGLDLGVEYRHGQRRIVSGATGELDRFEFAAKFGF